MAKSQYYLYNFFSNNNEISIYYLNDGTVTGQRGGSMFIFATVNGDIGHEEYRRLVGKITVFMWVPMPVSETVTVPRFTV